jgi:hypothetical protein
MTWDEIKPVLATRPLGFRVAYLLAVRARLDAGKAGLGGAQVPPFDATYADFPTVSSGTQMIVRWCRPGSVMCTIGRLT